MKRLFVSLFFLAGLLSLQTAKADEVDPLWAKVVVQHDSTKKWVAKNVEQQITLIKDGKAGKLTTIKKEYKAWEKEGAVYTVLSVTPPPKDSAKANKTLDLLAIFASVEASIYSNKAEVKRNAPQVIKGQICATFELTEMGTKVSLWVDADSGAPVQRVVEMSVPFVAEGTVTTNYQETKEGMRLPSINTTKMAINIPFKKAKIEMQDTYSNWFERP